MGIISNLKLFALASAVFSFAVAVSSCSTSSSLDKTRLETICELYSKADDFTQSDEIREGFALKLDTEAKLLSNKDGTYAELKQSAFDYYKEFKRVSDAKLMNQTGVIGVVSAEYLSATSYLEEICVK